MTAEDALFAPRHYRAPRDNHSALVDPPGSQIHHWLTDDQATAALRETEPLASWRPIARAEMFALARAYTSQYRDLTTAVTAPTISTASASPTFILSGHQPQLFHPGVWFKNFALSALAQQHQAIGINLIIDNDNAKTLAIRVPGGTVTAPHVVGVSFDQATAEMPFEERQLVDRGCWESFPQRVSAELNSLVTNPLVSTWWPEVVQQSRRTANVGQALSASRHQLERQWGLETLEVPLSWLCETRSFRQFALQLLLEPERLHQAYNGALATYRTVYHLRSHAHPVPDLTRDGDWFEAPFWLWSERDPRRRRLFVRRTAGGMECTDRAQLHCRWTSPTDAGEVAGAEQLAMWSQQGVRLRPRALLTTLYARLLLADLFLHGIGGGMYDQVTDLFGAKFWGVAPAPFATLTATLRLPIDHPVATDEDVRALNQRLRDAWFHPERYVAGSDAGVAELVQQKRHWYEQQLPRGTRLARHRMIEAVNETLRTHLVALRDRWLVERTELVQRSRRHALLASREFAFCLFPEEELRRVLLELSSAAL